MAESRVVSSRRRSFFTPEGAVIAAIVVMLAGLVIPTFRSLRARSADDRAKAELIRIRNAIERFIADVGTPPDKTRYGGGADLHRLIGEGLIPTGAYYAIDDHQGDLEQHLVHNGPGGPDSEGYAGWKGPYLQAVPPDPWGYAYVVVLYPLHRADGRDAVVVSAGSNGVMDGDYSSVRGAVAAGDDLIEVIRRRAR